MMNDDKYAAVAVFVLVVLMLVLIGVFDFLEGAREHEYRMAKLAHDCPAATEEE